MKKKIIIISVLVVLSIFIVVLFAYFKEQHHIQQRNFNRLEKEKREATLIENMKHHYHENVTVKKDGKLYRYDNNQYIEAGNIKKGLHLLLDKVDDFDSNHPYFKIKDTPYYIFYNIIEETDIVFDVRYRNYIFFPLEITTNKNTEFFDIYGNLLFVLEDESNFFVLEKYNDYFGVIMFDQVVYIKTNSISFTKEVEVPLEKAESIASILYHFIYLHGDTSCNETICHSEDQIEEHFSYLKNENYFTATTKEVLRFIKGEINLPKKTLLITIDDGARAEYFIPFLEKYQLNATLFLVSSWYPKDKFFSSYLEIASHTHDMHTTGVCPQGQGGGLNCLDSEKILSDLKVSRDTLDQTVAMAYPFFEYNEYSVDLVAKAGFEIAFIGGQKKITPGINPLMSPRYTMFSNTSVDALARIVAS